jgi:hypothetical protein
MARNIEIRDSAAQKLMLACSLAFSGFLLAQEDAGTAQFTPEPLAAALAARAHYTLEDIGQLHVVLDDMGRLFDECQALMLGQPKRLDVLQKHPFTLISEMLNRGFQEIKALRGTGELGSEGVLFIEAYAQARRKAERNAHLARQMLVTPTVFESTLDKQGLVALSQLASRAH